MATGPGYRVPFRRRREGRTNYRKRLALLLSNKPRMVVRKSNRDVLIQLVEFSREGDRTVLTCSARMLRRYGAEPPFKSVPAAYLTGLLFGYRALEAGYEEAVLDIGLATSTKGGKVYAAVKGALDAGLHVPCDEEMFPDETRLRGEHIRDYRGVDVPSVVETVKQNILKEYGDGR
ncbi:50S ribosomal protein L18 [Methermicoccus shengliensis]|uniref:Large ribosomal subunit protein uL18 n=1 Tax=Methermicoccus shengliensis TaxID=660064 RepID=A0A832VML4_9EURY|nr:50S ribosomal protein L18 [Methermicoccus shengliensis]KUK05100.1 MAG: 50S ribosomal protein L18P [Euryarchaeota archaeon 55_53]KUK30393.1 MAG: 50S ribosomal protein L18P [Methanosarcinales archeaon 56_1174]MDI3488416.1 large subunit ribosomal protein [Methanosarcinales archaeon]MDN5294665.1 large subunit ribosomal protein [Methanosarcinales archaeon]HIH69376.1 50S ribosomal protein L18 [Methermicoccus shengliensis]